MITDNLDKLSIGKKRYTIVTGLENKIRLYFAISMLGLIVTWAVHVSYLWIAIAIIVIWTPIAVQILSRKSSEWRSHHFPMMTLWHGTLAFSHVYDVHDFGELANFFMKMAFEANEDAENQADALIKLTNLPLFDVMNEFGCFNKNKSLDAPEMVEFKRMLSDYQEKQPGEVKHRILFSMIIYKLSGKTAAAKYLLARMSGDAF